MAGWAGVCDVLAIVRTCRYYNPLYRPMFKCVYEVMDAKGKADPKKTLKTDGTVVVGEDPAYAPPPGAATTTSRTTTAILLSCRRGSAAGHARAAGGARGLLRA